MCKLEKSGAPHKFERQIRMKKKQLNTQPLVQCNYSIKKCCIFYLKLRYAPTSSNYYILILICRFLMQSLCSYGV